MPYKKIKKRQKLIAFSLGYLGMIVGKKRHSDVFTII